MRFAVHLRDRATDIDTKTQLNFLKVDLLTFTKDKQMNDFLVIFGFFLRKL